MIKDIIVNINVKSRPLNIMAKPLPFVLQLAQSGYRDSLNSDANFLAGLNIFKGQVTHKAVAATFGHKFVSPKEILENV